MRSWLPTASVIQSLFAMLLGSSIALAADEPEATVDPFAQGAALVYAAQGDVKVVRAGQPSEQTETPAVAVERGAVLMAGDLLRLGEDSKARILYRDGKLVAVAAAQEHKVGQPAKESASPLWEAVAAKFRNLTGRHMTMTGVGGVRGGENPRLPELAPIAPLASWVLEDRPAFRWVAVKAETVVYHHSLETKTQDGAWQPVWTDMEWHEASMPFPYARDPLAAGVYRWRVIAVAKERKPQASVPVQVDGPGGPDQTDTERQTDAPPAGDGSTDQQWETRELSSTGQGYTFSILPAQEGLEVQRNVAQEVAALAAGETDDFERELLIGHLWERKGVFVYDRAAEHYQRALAIREGDIEAARALVELYARIGILVRR